MTARVRALREHRASAFEFLAFLSSVLLLQGARFLFSFIAARILAAPDFVAWVLTLTLLGYSPVLLGGVGNGMNRLIPILVGRGLADEASRVEREVWGFVLAILGALAVAATVVAVLEPQLATFCAAAAVAIGGTIVYQVQQFAYRARLRFGVASLQQGLSGLVVLAVIGFLGLRGTADLSTVTWGWAVAIVAAILIGASLIRPRVALPRRRELADLVRVGAPIMAAGLLFSLLTTIDRWIVAGATDASQSSDYAFASVVASGLVLLPMVISQQTYPRMAMAFGMHASGSDLSAMARRQSLLALGVTIPAALLGGIAAAILIPALLPGYEGAILPTWILMGGTIALAGCSGQGNVMTVIEAQVPYLRSQGIALVAALATMLVGVRVAGPTGAAIGYAIGQVVLLLTLHRESARQIAIRLPSVEGRS